MKKIKIWCILMLAVMTVPMMVACTSDEGDSGVTTELIDGLYYDGMSLVSIKFR